MPDFSKLPDSTLLVEIDNTRKQNFKDQLKSGKYNTVLIINLEDAENGLLESLASQEFAIELSAASYCGASNIERPTFMRTRAIKKLGKKYKNRHLNVKRCQFSFSKFNAAHLSGLIQCKSLREVKLDYYMCKYNNNEIPLEHKKYSEELFFNNLAKYIATNKSLTKLEINVYRFKTSYTGDPDKKLEETNSGFAAYFPYGEYESEHPPYCNIDLSEQTVLVLLKALITNYSLIELNPGGWLAGPFHRVYDINEWLAKGNLTALLKNSLQEFAVSCELKSCHDFLNAILKRNQAAAVRLRQAAISGKADNFKQDNERYGSISVLTGKKVAAKSDALHTTYSEKITQIGIPTQAQTIASKALPVTTSVNQASKDSVKAAKVSADSKCPFSNLLKFFRSSTSKNSTKKTFSDAVKPIMSATMQSSINSFYMPQQSAEEVATAIVNAAINGAINGLKAMPGGDPNNQIDPYNALSGLAYNAAFAPAERNKLVNLMVGQLLVAQNLDLTMPNAIVQRCLIGCLARQIKTMNYITFDDDKMDVVSVTNNKNIKISEKVSGLQAAINYAVNDANNKMFISTVPSAPPLDEEMSKDMIGSIQQPAMPASNASLAVASCLN